jgi:hypothetical protein
VSLGVGLGWPATDCGIYPAAAMSLFQIGPVELSTESAGQPLAKQLAFNTRIGIILRVVATVAGLF